MQSHQREREIHSIVKKKLSKGASNISGATPNLGNQATFGRKISEYMFQRVKHYFSLKEETHHTELQLLDHACAALMGEVYKTGGCGQHASIALMEYLKQGVNKPIEYIQIFGRYHTGSEGNHAIVVTGREADFNKDIKKWGKFFVIDAWADNSYSYPNADEEKSTNEYPRQFYTCFKSVNNFYFNCRFEKNLNSQQWSRLADFFEFLRMFDEKAFKIFLRYRANEEVNSSKELAIIHKKIDAHIAEFRRLAAKPHLDAVAKPTSFHHISKSLLESKASPEASQPINMIVASANESLMRSQAKSLLEEKASPEVTQPVNVIVAAANESPMQSQAKSLLEAKASPKVTQQVSVIVAAANESPMQPQTHTLFQPVLNTVPQPQEDAQENNCCCSLM